MNKEPESLPDFVRRVRTEKRLSLMDVKRRAGGHISDGYVSLIENGQVLNVGPTKLLALARGLGVPEDEIYAVQRGQSLKDPSAQEIQLLTAFRGMQEHWQEDLLRIAKLFHQQHAKPTDEVGEVRKTKRAPRAA